MEPILEQFAFFENIGNVWTQIGADIIGEAAQDIATNIALSANGNIIVIGAIGNDGNGQLSGHARIFENIADVWTQIGDDIDGEASNDLSGNGIALSSNGDIVAIGATENGGNGSNSGHVRVFENNAGVWTQIGSDIDGEMSSDSSGGSISLSADGSVLAIGARANDGNGSNNSGHVRVFENMGGVWTQIGTDIDGENSIDNFGSSVSLSSNGTILAVGAPGNNGNGSNSGHVRVFRNEGGSWTQLGADIDGEAESDASGTGVSLSGDGNTLSIGARFNDGGGKNAGHYRIYDLASLLAVDEIKESDFSVYPNPARSHVTLKLKPEINLSQVTIYDVLGKEVKTYKKANIPISELTSGIYFFEILTDKGKVVKKIIKL